MTGIKWQLTLEVIIAAKKPGLQCACKLNDLLLLVVVFPGRKMRYSSVNSNRSKSCAKVSSVLSFSSALLIWSCSVCQPSSSSTWYNFSVLQVVAGWSLPFPSSTLGNCLHQDPYQQGCLQPFAGELWGWQGSVCSLFAGRRKLMLITLQAHLPNQGKCVATVSIVPNPK